MPFTTDIYWPDDLVNSNGGRLPLLDGFENDEPDNLTANQPDRGPAKTRRSGTSAVEPVVCSFGLWDFDTRSRFRSFYRNDIASGALPFIFPAWIDGDDVQMQILKPIPKWSLRDHLWVVQVNIFIWAQDMVG
jgi:hypothetical protein